MRAGAHPPVGTAIGKALEGLPSGSSVIRVLVTLQVEAAMGYKRLLTTAALLVLAGLSLGAAMAPEGVLSLERWVPGGAGGRAAGDRFTLDSTVGQGVAGLTWGGRYQVCPGFWCGAARYAMFLPLTLRG